MKRRVSKHMGKAAPTAQLNRNFPTVIPRREINQILAHFDLPAVAFVSRGRIPDS
jgi:hypothetical protein